MIKRYVLFFEIVLLVLICNYKFQCKNVDISSKYSSCFSDDNSQYLMISLTPGETQSSVNICWISDYSEENSNTVIVFSSSDNCDIISSNNQTTIISYADGTKGLLHQGTINGLGQNQKYVYRLSNNMVDWSREYSYSTTDNKNYSIAVVADPQLNGGYIYDRNNIICATTTTRDSWGKVVGEVFKSGASLILCCGDQVNSDSENEYRDFFSPSDISSLLLAPAIGNHDKDGFYQHFRLPNMFEKNINSKSVKGNYYFQYNDLLIVVLNTGITDKVTTEESAKEYVDIYDNVLNEAIDKYTDYKWLIVEHHISTESVGVHCADDNVELMVEAGFEELMNKYNVDFVFSGHDHCYSRTYPIKNRQPDMKYDGNDFKNVNGTIYFSLNTASGMKYSDVLPKNLYNKNNDNYPKASDNSFGSRSIINGINPANIYKAIQNYNPTYLIINIQDKTISVKLYTINSKEILDDVCVTKGNKSENTNIKLKRHLVLLGLLMAIFAVLIVKVCIGGLCKRHTDRNI